ncbi:uncharacterized protein LOC119668624 [Teleopsis dalmanni]|uniref:uncharacterized protein LOC119668624 n=1 Tax=Teleopsis dalmanni TaxID=139649 RepID=UPI0018CEEB06|nr:uncharacterized protein LOC119668624 [Teleopsis dalmanni]
MNSQSQQGFPPNTPAAIPSTTFAQRAKKNRPQTISSSAVFSILISGGMNMAFNFDLLIALFVTTPHIRYCWFIGGIIGAIVGAVLCNRIPKKITLIISASLVMVGGIILLIRSLDFDAIIAARYIDGIATGLTFVPGIVLISEEAVSYMRGKFVVLIDSLSFTFGIWIQILIRTSYNDYFAQSFNIIKMQGVLSIICGVCAFVSIYFLIESPVLQVVQNKEEDALKGLTNLQRPSIRTQETYALLEEHKRYVAYNNEMPIQESFIKGLPALLKLCILRALGALTFSYLTNAAFFFGSSINQFTTSNTILVLPFQLFCHLRLLGTLIGYFTVDSIGRKLPMLVGVLICGGLAVGVAINFSDEMNILDESKMKVISYLLYVFQFFAGLIITSSSAYLSEAFPLAAKPYNISVTFIFEMVVHCIIAATAISFPVFFAYFIATVVLYFAFVIFGFLCLPETKNATLLEAQQQFEKFLVIRRS